jgi:hypothetical protein
MGIQLLAGTHCLVVPGQNWILARQSPLEVMTSLLRWIFSGLMLSSLCCAAAPKTTLITVLTDAECEKFGRELADSVNKANPMRIVEALDLTGFADRVMVGLDFNQNERSQFLEGLSRSFKSGLQKQFAIWKNGRFVRVAVVNGEKRVLLRLLSSDGTLNFIDWVCERNAAGDVIIVDGLPFVTGELMSETSRRAVLPLLAESKKGFIERLTTKESAYVREIASINQAIKLIQEGSNNEASGILEALPGEVKIMPFVLALRLRAAQSSSKKVYLAVIEDWERALPDNPSLDLISIDGCVMRKDYAGCIDHIESLQKRVGPDGYLRALKGNVSFMNHDIEGARTSFKAAVAIEPTLARTYDMWFGVEMQAKNWGGLVEALSAFESNFPKADIWAGIQAKASWADFRASKECQLWLEKRTAKTVK